jgi:hypothetical protein
VIDTTGKWWIGSEANDLDEYLRAYADESTPISLFGLSQCDCSSIVFNLEADDDEGCARRICTTCREAHLICDSAEHWDGASPIVFRCIECASDRGNVGVAFSLYPEGDVRWLYVGVRCDNCGILGCFTGWKVAYSPSGHLISQT